jgi:cellulose synthase/poly-beta-1,6-N-acetylglucosamine synthase-like glycosyltransferase
MELYVINLLIYNAFVAALIFFSIIYYLVAMTSIFIRPVKYKFPRVSDDQLPTVTVQIPVYNDPVAIRCIKRCLAFNYPKDKYHIVVADDSNDGITSRILNEFSEGRDIKIVRRTNREGFKPGALNNALKYSTGSIIVVFDSDFVPRKDFLRKVVTPFLFDDKIAVVQSRMGFVNYKHNTVSRFAGVLLMIYHHCVLPISNKVNTVFFCGTGGAIRKDVLLSVGGWNGKSVTEDADLSVKILQKGYRNIYVPNLEAAGEVPFTLKSFLRQQMRWAYGITRVFMDHWKSIWFSRSFSFPQRTMITFITTGYIITPFVVGAAVTGQLGWLITPPKPLAFGDIISFGKTLLLTSGFVALGIIALHRAGRINDFFKLYFAAFFVGIVLAGANMIAFFRSIAKRRTGWIRTPKMGSNFILEFFRRLFSRRK